MVEYSLRLDSVFGSLADPTRRDILRRVARSELTVGEISADYDMSMAAVSKHIKMLEKAKLVIKRRRGKEQLVRARTGTLAEAREYLEWYRRFMDGRLDSLEEYLNKEA
ncbi:MAG TPA: metalloregulator ArsR/SmtB family transcription factor [Candidatus Saccharimonadales bacterium]|jgi:DNA-binding transcriptional ArsR family regulator|nr:metalloregulator ArsR/SmtB family transcription factor [Candidatus Saccharimonadales bacterium]